MSAVARSGAPSMRRSPIDPKLSLRTIAVGLDHPEAVCWDPFRASVLAGSESGTLHRVGLDAGAPLETVVHVEGGFLLGIALDAAGDAYVCDVGNHGIVRVGHDGSLSRHGGYIEYPNYPAFGPDGTLYVSDSGSIDEATGTIVAIAPDGAQRVLDTRPLLYSNGLAVRDGYLYVVESGLPGVSRVPLGGGEVEIVVELARTAPDGIAFDAEGGLWVGCYQPNHLYRVAPDSSVALLVDDWTGEYVHSPTNVAFAGGSLETLVLASLCGWWVKAIDPGVRGAPLQYPVVG